MTRRLNADHEQLFAVFGGDEAKAAEAHQEFAAWLASNTLGSGSLSSSPTERAAPPATPPASVAADPAVPAVDAEPARKP